MYLANTNKKATIGHQRPKTLFTNIDLEMWILKKGTAGNVEL